MRARDIFAGLAGLAVMKASERPGLVKALRLTGHAQVIREESSRRGEHIILLAQTLLSDEARASVERTRGHITTLGAQPENPVTRRINAFLTRHEQERQG